MSRTVTAAHLSTARDVYPRGTSGERCKRHNQLRKALAAAFELYGEFGEDLNLALINRLTNADMAAAAARAGVNPPTSDATRNAVKFLLRVLLTLGQVEDLGSLTTLPAEDGDLHSALLKAMKADRPTTAVTELGLAVLLLPIDRQA
ncbi:hypothetical protein [Streptomyces ipomoeae]|uniref:hypothetical protein n=1 Tax=Streptomyces ipomoeae TaxID=103232 RepID=UPI0011466430|nr:hypothetical protein [Streptomyces ipomoeae]TQE33142.1 hypothetical protein Sipo7851_21865 [Streptomyces ipomoeae]